MKYALSPFVCGIRRLASPYFLAYVLPSMTIFAEISKKMTFRMGSFNGQHSCLTDDLGSSYDTKEMVIRGNGYLKFLSSESQEYCLQKRR